MGDAGGFADEQGIEFGQPAEVLFSTSSTLTRIRGRS